MRLTKSLLFLLFSSVLGMNSGCATLNSQDNFSGQNQKKEELSQKRYALLLVDANYPEKAFNPEKNINGVWNLEEELENMAEVLQQANHTATPVFEIYIPHHDLDTPTTEAELARYRDDNWIKFPKFMADAFENTDLDQQLKKRGITNLVIMGRNQGACVKWTVEHALRLGYTIHTSYEVMQGNASYAYQDRNCAVTSQNKKEIVPCRSLVEGSGIEKENPNHSYNFLNPKHKKLPDGTGVKPADEDTDLEFYHRQTDLMESYQKLPIFK